MLLFHRSNMTEKAKLSLVSKLTSELDNLDQLVVNVYADAANLASVTRRAMKTLGHSGSLTDATDSVSSINTSSRSPSVFADDDSTAYIDPAVISRIHASFVLSVAAATNRLADSVHFLSSQSSRVLSLCSELNDTLETACTSQLERFFEFNHVFEALRRLQESLVEEMDLIFYWAYARISPGLVPTDFTPSFSLASAFLSEKCLTRVIWHDEICPMVTQLRL